MPDSKPRCVHPVKDGAAACNKTEAQHGPTTGHAFTLTYMPEPDAGPSAQAEHDRASMPAGEDARVYRPDSFARMEFNEQATGPGQGEPYSPGTLVEGNPLDGALEAGPYRVPDPEVTLRTEMPDGTLVEVRVAHPTHDTVKMARSALVAAEYVMGAIARGDKAAPIQHPVPD